MAKSISTHPCKGMAKLLPLLCLALLGQGCVGGGAFVRKTVTIQNPEIGKTPAVWNVRQQGPRSETDAVGDSKAWLEEHWGKPARLVPSSAQGGGDIWTYRFGCLWSGVVAVVVLPIPLALPVGRERVSFLVQDGRVVSAKVVRHRTCGAIAGCIIGPCGMRWGTSALDEDE